MSTKHRLLVTGILVVVFALSLVSLASAQTAPFPAVSVAGAVGFKQNDVASFAAFGARAVGPAMPGEEHQPARGFLAYRDQTGLTYTVSVQHIHVHAANEVHFGGPIATSSDPSLMGQFAHAVAIDGGFPGRNSDQFSILVTPSDVHEHAPTVPVGYGDLVVKALVGR